MFEFGDHRLNFDELWPFIDISFPRRDRNNIEIEKNTHRFPLSKALERFLSIFSYMRLLLFRVKCKNVCDKKIGEYPCNFFGNTSNSNHVIVLFVIVS